ncbi:MAG: hypothetical protein ABWY05_11900 [Noviherbaspirillum sp.]
MPNRKKELSIHTRFLVLGLVCSLMIAVLCIAAFSPGANASHRANGPERFAQSGMQVAAAQPAAYQALKRRDAPWEPAPAVR